MDILLSPIEARILGSLIEKSIATPEYYPLSLNALVNACNQKSNRNPVMELDEETVKKMVDKIRGTKLVWQVSTAGNRVSKYEHNISLIQDFTQQEVSILCELFLRGPQTLGELRTHTARFYEFKNLEEVEEVLQKLSLAQKGPFVQMLPPERGRRENRYAHLFCGEVKIDAEKLEPIDTYTINAQNDSKRIDVLEQELALLKDEMKNIKEQFASFKKQFE